MTLQFSLNQIQETAQKIIAENPEKVLLFNGPMGAGKTTLIQALCKQLGVTSNISSPTFSLVNEYHTKDNQTVYHFDMYRIKNQQEALAIGIEDYLYSGNWCFIEWAENIPDLLPEKYTTLTINPTDHNNRIINLF